VLLTTGAIAWTSATAEEVLKAPPEPRVPKSTAVLPEAAMTASSLRAAEEAFDAPVTDPDGRILYIIDINETALGSYSRMAAPVDGFPDYLKPETRVLAAAMASQYGFAARSLTSWIGSTITTFLNEQQVTRLRADSRVAAITPDRRVRLSASLWQNSGRYSWGTVSIGPQLVQSNPIPVYVLDTGVGNHWNLMNVTRLAPPTVKEIGCNLHSEHVAGIIGATGSTPTLEPGSKGVIGGIPIISVGVGEPNTSGSLCAITNDATLVSGYLNGLEYIRSRVLTSGRVAIINISANRQEFRTIFALGAKLAQVATPNGSYPGAFIVQSAGNGTLPTAGAPYGTPQSACNAAYDAQLLADGIMVVGAMDANGQQIVPLAGIPGMRGPQQASLNGSNFGPCVDVWAPGKDIASTWRTPSYDPASVNDTHFMMSGTSMAAPHVAAVAAHLATAAGATTPSQIESLVRGSMFSLGSVAQDQRPIYTTNLTGSRPHAIPSPLFAIGSDTKDVIIPSMQPFKIRYDSVGASSCSLSAKINGSPWYSVPNFQTSYNWDDEWIYLGAGNYRWTVDCVSSSGHHNSATIRAEVLSTAATATFYVNDTPQANGGTYTYYYSNSDFHPPVNFRYSSSQETDCDLVAQSGPVGGPLSPWYSYPHLGIAFDWGPVVWTPGDYRYTITCYGGATTVVKTVNIASR
jgi:hypothetical protein